jgi:hypothetical protein
MWVSSSGSTIEGSGDQVARSVRDGCVHTLCGSAHVDVLADVVVVRDVLLDDILDDDGAALDQGRRTERLTGAGDGTGRGGDGVRKVAAVIRHKADHVANGVLADLALDVVPDGVQDSICELRVGGDVHAEVVRRDCRLLRDHDGLLRRHLELQLLLAESSDGRGQCEDHKGASEEQLHGGGRWRKRS